MVPKENLSLYTRKILHENLIRISIKGLPNYFSILLEFVGFFTLHLLHCMRSDLTVRFIFHTTVDRHFGDEKKLKISN